MTGLVRAMWNINELPTDEATCSWGDGLQELNSATYDPSHPWVKLYYTRLTLGITTCNQYLQMAGSDVWSPMFNSRNALFNLMLIF